MKKILLLLVLFMVSCSSDEQPTVEPEQTCYNIISRGTSQDGDFIIINYSAYTQKKYAVSNYLDWINERQLCEPITLTQLPL